MLNFTILDIKKDQTLAKLTVCYDSKVVWAWNGEVIGGVNFFVCLFLDVCMLIYLIFIVVTAYDANL